MLLYLVPLISNKLEQLDFKYEKIIGIQKHAEKVRKETDLLGRQNYFVAQTTTVLEYEIEEVTREEVTQVNDDKKYLFSKIIFEKLSRSDFFFAKIM